MKNRETLVRAIIERLSEEIQPDKKLKKKLKVDMAKYVLPGDMQDYIVRPEEKIPSLDNEILYFIASKLYNIRATMSLKVDEYFTPREIKEYETSYELEIEETLKFPYTFKDVVKVDEGDYLTTISAQEIYKLMNNHLIQYNHDTQREGRKIKSKKDPNIVLTVPKTDARSVRQIAQLIAENKLIKTVITFNARLGSTDDEEGEELYYDESSKSLTVTEGTLLDVLDGFHRMQGVSLALTKNPKLDTTFKLNILNFSKKQAQQYFAQINTYNPVRKDRVKELGESNYSDFVTNQIVNNVGDFKDRIVHGGIGSKQDALTTYKILSEAIEKEFSMKNKAEAISISRLLSNFFKELFYSFPNEFLGDISDVREKSLINMPSCFSGYIVLAKRMIEEKVSFEFISDIIGGIDFLKENPYWEEIGIYKDGRTIRKPNDKFAEFFRGLDIEKYKEKEEVRSE
ncbi:DNA sulfur modification protein DndB [Priestia flexa]|uniref:DNA sulfur modification protein DndB n=1 Tax=Priestia flexa TaxID=86664 RepID=UPI0004741D5B|nr:DNA sulfur modification protein DndB [Priestia flexa]